MTLRDRLIDYVKEQYKTEPEYLWAREPDCAVFRHAENGKWFGAVTSARGKGPGLSGETEVLNVKVSDPFLADVLVKKPGYFKSYRIRRGNWISILLDGTVPFDELCGWLDESYLTTAPKEKKSRLRPPKEWLIPANPKYYDIEAAFAGSDEINWKQGAGIRTGDTVYIYMAAPVSAILYRCAVTETDIPFPYDDGNIRMKALMKIRLLRRYRPDQFPFASLGREYGIFAVRGPRGVPHGLSEALKKEGDPDRI